LGCGSNGSFVYALTQTTANANDSVIRVGLTPPPNAIGHATNPNQGCFDDKDGNNSVDFVLYENLRDQLKTELCYDENRVFASGDSSGSFMANELGCRYAGNPQFGTGGLRSQYALRGIITNTGGLPTVAPYAATCNSQPMAGMWIAEISDPENPIAAIKAAVNRAMTVNGCSGNNVDTATQVSYAIGGGNVDGTCKLIQGCPAIYPLVTCFFAGNAHSSHTNIANPGFATFLEQFTSAAFVN